MVAEMKETVKEPLANTSHAKHRQHIVQAITQLIRSEVTNDAARKLYIGDTVGSKPATKTAPMLLQLAASLQEMESTMSGVNCGWAIMPIVTVPETVAKALQPQSTHNSKKRGRPRKDPVAAAKEAEQKMKDAHNEGIIEWTKVFERRQRFMDAGYGDEYVQWETDLKRMILEQSKLDPMDEEASDKKGNEIKTQRDKMKKRISAFQSVFNADDELLLMHHEHIVLPDIDDKFEHVPNWEDYTLPPREWCIWMDGFEQYMKKKHPDAGYVHEKRETDWFDKMHPNKEAVDTFYPETEPDPESEPEPVQMGVTASTIATELESAAKPTTCHWPGLNQSENGQGVSSNWTGCKSPRERSWSGERFRKCC
jgi:hypothetical protein